MAGLNLCSLAVPEKPREAAVEQEVILDWEIDMQGSFGERFCSYQ